jgi:ABC-type transport system substrate-binding protein
MSAVQPNSCIALRSVPIVAVLLCVGCNGGGGFSKRKSSDALVFRYAIHTSPTTLDPGKVQDVDTGDLVQNVFEGLFSYSESNEIQPQLAESYELADGGRTYLIKLRNAKFHNGRVLTAQDVKFSFERHADPSFGSPTAESYLSDIVGFKDKFSKKTPDISGIKVIDDHTISITIDKPRPYFLGKLTYPCAFVVAKEAAKDDEINEVEEAIGTGPFRLAAYAKDQQVDLDANPDYYLGSPKIAKLVRPVIKDASTRLLKYRNGELDLLTLERQDLPAAEADATLKSEILEVARPAIYYVGLNQGLYAPFRDVRVRKAFAMAINREKIAKDIIKLPVAKGFIPPGIVGAREDIAGIPFDPGTARNLLSQAGFTDGKGMPPLTITYREGRPDSQLLAVSVVTELKKNLGIDVATRSMEWRTFLEARNAKKLQFVGLSWFADYLDPENFLSFLLASDAGENRDGYSNPEFDTLCEQADVESDPVKRIALYQQAENILIEDAARIPVYFGKDVILVKSYVKGLRTNLFGTMSHLTVDTSKE